MQGLEKLNKTQQSDITKVCRSQVTVFHLQFANMGDYSGILLKQAYFQGVRGKPIHLKAGSDKLTSVAIPFAFVGTTFAMIFRGMWHMTHGTGKLKWYKHCSHEDDALDAQPTVWSLQQPKFTRNYDDDILILHFIMMVSCSFSWKSSTQSMCIQL